MIHTIDLHFLGHAQTIAAYLVETSEGPILIETGPHSTFEWLKIGVEKIGYQLSDIKHVFVSHIHLDHAGVAWYFARKGATIYVHPVGVTHLVDPSRLMHSARRIYKEQMALLWGDMHPIPADQIVATAHAQEITIGQTTLKAWHTPGHATHHIAWQMEKVLFTGDVGGVKINNGIVVPPCPPPDINLEDWQSSIALIRTLDLEALYLTHFGKVEHISAHLDELWQRLEEWAAWLQPYSLQEEVDREEVQGLFKEYVAEELRTNGISENGIVQYETANPSWMSVAGLIRYWRKKQPKNE